MEEMKNFTITTFSPLIQKLLSLDRPKIQRLARTQLVSLNRMTVLASEMFY
jgi:hypothetical protein